MGSRKNHTEQFINKTIKFGSHLYSEGKDALDELGEQVRERTHKIVHKVNEEPVPSLLITIGIGMILSGLIVAKLTKR